MRRPAWLAERLTALRTLPALHERRDSQLALVAQQMDDITVPPGAVVARAGQPVAQLAIVLEGELRSECDTFGPGATVGWPEMWERGLAARSVVASEPTRLLVLGRAGFRAVRGLDLDRT